MSTTTPLRRLAEARPDIAERTRDLVGPAERETLLASILATEEAAVPSPAQRRARLATAMAAPALVGAAVVAVVVAGTPSADVPAPVDGPATTAAAPVVLNKVRLAVAAADELILHMRSDHGNGVLWESWHDTVDQTSRMTSLTMAGRPIYDHELREGLGDMMTVRVVSYNDRAWWTYTTSPGRGDTKNVEGLLPDDIRSQLADGTLEEIGPATLDGREVLHLKWTPRSKPGFVTRPGDMWVDASTYLPVRSVNRWGVNGEKSTRSEYEWFPRSAENLAKLTAPVPPGFVQRAGAPEEPVGAEGVG